MAKESAENSKGEVIRVENITTGAISQPLWFAIDRRSASFQSHWRAMKKGRRSTGMASTVLCISPFRPFRRLLAIYLDGESWRSFEGEREFLLTRVVVSWRVKWAFPWLGLFAEFSVNSDGQTRRYVYFRPNLRQFFEGGWALDDSDIGSVIAGLAAKSVTRDRVKAALEMSEL